MKLGIDYIKLRKKKILLRRRKSLKAGKEKKRCKLEKNFEAQKIFLKVPEKS